MAVQSVAEWKASRAAGGSIQPVAVASGGIQSVAQWKASRPASAPVAVAPVPAAPVKQASFLDNVIGGAKTVINDVGSALTTAPAPKSFDMQTALKTGWDTIVNTVKDTAARLQAPLPNISQSGSEQLTKAVGVGEGAIGLLNTAFLGITAPLQAAANVPGIGYVADAANNVFSALGKGGSDLAEGAVTALPVSQETKDKIMPLAKEIGALVAQIYAGKLGSDGVKLVTDKSKQIVDAVHSDVKAGAITEAPTAPATQGVQSVAEWKAAGKPAAPQGSPNLSPDLKTIETGAYNQIKTNGMDKTVSDYLTNYSTEGKTINTDNARELFPAYQADRSLSAGVHEPASDVAKAAYAKLLETNKGVGDNSVLFTGGGTGAGKSAAVGNVPEINKLSHDASIIYDTNMNKFASAKTKIDQALKNGFKANIVYVYRDPIEAFKNGTLPRAERMGRTVPLSEHVSTHVTFPDAALKLIEHYKNDSRVGVGILDNSRGRGNAVVIPPSEVVAFLKEKRYSVGDGKQLTEQARKVLEQARANGSISERTYNGTRGSSSNSAENGRQSKQPHKGKSVEKSSGATDTKTYPTIHQGGEVKMVEGTPIKIVDGIDTFLHKDSNGNWSVSEATTGRDLTGGGFESKTFAISAAKANIEKVGEAKFKKLIADNQLPETAKPKSENAPPAESTASPKAIKGSGDAFTSRVLERMQEENPQLKGDATVQHMNMKEDAAKAADLVATDKQQAYEIAMGEKTSPDVTSTAVNIAMSEKALADGNFDLAAKLIRNRSLEQTRRGQEIVTERGSIADNSTSRYVKELLASRLDALGKDYLNNLKLPGRRVANKTKGIERLDAEVKKVEGQIKSKKLDTKTALALLDKLACI